MKMVKSLLLGSAAGLVAVAGAQAADLPVKAKPVEYVKICSIYGAGFFYIPGTDSCIKIGGWIRAEYGFQTGNSEVPYYLVGAGFNMGAGDKLDVSKTKPLSAGSFAVMQPKTQHFAWTKEETVVQVHGIGPWAINYVNPADDPRQK